MADFVALLTTLSQVLGVPLTIAFAWQAFVVRADHYLIKDLQTENKELRDKLEQLKDSQKTELNAIYDKINPMAEGIAFIKGWIEGQKVEDK